MLCSRYAIYLEIILILSQTAVALYARSNEAQGRYLETIPEVVYTLSQHFDEIFQGVNAKHPFPPLEDCTKVFIYGTSKIEQLPQINYMDSALSLIMSNRIRPFSLKLKFAGACSIAIYLSPEIISLFEKVEQDWVASIPGGTVRSFHFFVVHHLNKAFLQHPFMRRLSNVLLLVPSTTANGPTGTDTWKLFAPKRYGDSQSVVSIAALNTTKLELISPKIFWNKWKDLQGQHFRMGVPLTISDKSVSNYRQQRKYRYLAVLMSEASAMLNATPKLVPQDITYGNGLQLQNGTWTSYIGKLMDDTIDISVPFAPFLYQYNVLDMSKGVIFTPIKFFAPLPKKTDITLKFLIEPFDQSIWIAIFLCILANVAVLYFLMGATSQLPGSLRGRLYFVILKITDFVRVLIDQPIPDDVVASSGYGSNSTRVIYLVWLLIMIVVGNLYKSVVISILVEPVYVNPPLTFSELVHSDFHVNFLFYKAFQFDTRLPWVKDLKHPVTDYKMNFPGCLKSLLDGPKVCIFVYNYLYLFAPEHLMDASGRKQFLESKDSVYSTSSFFGISRLNPQLNEAMDSVVDVIVEGGLEIRWVKMEFHQKSVITMHRKQKDATFYEFADSLVNKKLMLYPVLILIAGLAIGIVCFGTELLWVPFLSTIFKSMLPLTQSPVEDHQISYVTSRPEIVASFRYETKYQAVW